jgi:hypothetical protein
MGPGFVDRKKGLGDVRMTSLLIPSSDYAKLRELAIKRGTGVGDIIREAIREYLGKHEEKEGVSEPARNRPKFPKTELPLASLPSTKPIIEPVAEEKAKEEKDKAKGGSNDLIAKYRAAMKLWSSDFMIESYNKSKEDDPLRLAIIEELKDRLANGLLIGDERDRAIRFLRDAGVEVSI